MTDSIVLDAAILALAFIAGACFGIVALKRAQLRLKQKQTRLVAELMRKHKELQQEMESTLAEETPAPRPSVKPGHVMFEGQMVPAFEKMIILDLARVDQIGVEAALQERIHQIAKNN